MVLKRLVISNFRGVRDLNLALAPLTVFVGPNGSGKSTVLSALLPRSSFEPREHWRHETNARPRIRLEFADGRVSELQGNAARGDWGKQRVQFANFDVRRMRQPNQVQKASLLEADGGNLANAFASLTRNEQAALAKQFCTLAPTFADVDAEPFNKGTHRLRFQDRWSPDIWYTPDEVSDGTILLLAYLCLQWQRDRPDVLAVEDPEHGLHPYLIGQLVRVLRGISEGTIGPQKMQVLIATHSPELLDHVVPAEVRFFGRATKDGSVTVEHVDAADPSWEESFREYRESLGQIWLAGGLGGVP